MQRNYLVIKQFLEQEFPELQGNISGGNYPPPAYAVLLMQLVSIIHICIIPFALIGDVLWSYLPYFSSRGPPKIYKTAKQYPMQTFMILFFLVPTVVQSKITTGAFEIMLDDEVIFSKMAMGRFPDYPELLQKFQQALK